MKRYFKVFGYLLSVHVLALLVMTLFRLVEFIALHGMIVDAEASRVMAFVKGVWFDNVIACYISVLPVAVLLIAASLGGVSSPFAAWYQHLVCGMVCHRLHAFGSQYSLFPVFLQEHQFQHIRVVRLCSHHIGHALAGVFLLALYRPLFRVYGGVYLCARPSALLLRGALPSA